MIWTGRADEAAALGLLLDRTYAGFAAAAAQPRELDVEFLVGQLYLWVDNMLPAVAAGTAPPWARRAAARAVWRRLGFSAWPEHRRWMGEHLDGLGLDPAPLLGPEPKRVLPFRSNDGRLIPAALPVTAETGARLLADYDLTGGSVLGARMTVHGPARISGSLTVAAGSRRYTEAVAHPPELLFDLADVTSFQFAHGPVTLRDQASLVVTGDEATVATPGFQLAGRGLTCRPQDSLWAESVTARAAGEGEPATAEDLPPRAASGADHLGLLQHQVMLRLRMMRYGRLLRRWELAAAAELFGGLNADLFRVRPAALRARWAARRVQEILATPDGLQRAFLRQVTRDLEFDVAGAAEPPAPVRITVGTADRLLGEIDFTGSRLRSVSTGRRETVIHLDVRRGGRETIVVIVLTEPLGTAPLTVSPDGLVLTRPPRLDATADDITLTIPLPGGDWTPRAAAGSWYVD